MNNPRITARERGLIKGAIRRAFSRSDLRRQVINACIIEHEDLSRPRVKKWGRCGECKQPTPKSYLVVDHIIPVIPLDRSFEEMSLDEVVDRMWCTIDNLQPICETCHCVKTSVERKTRNKNKKEKKDERSKAVKKSDKTAFTRSLNKGSRSRNRKETRSNHSKKTTRNGGKTKRCSRLYG